MPLGVFLRMLRTSLHGTMIIWQKHMGKRNPNDTGFDRHFDEQGFKILD